MKKNISSFMPQGNSKSLNDKAQMAMALVYTKGYPVQLACWIMSGMKKQTYSELKNRIDLMYRQVPEAMKVMGANAEKLDDTEVNRIIRRLKITGYWRDMPKAEYRDMLSAVKNRQ